MSDVSVISHTTNNSPAASETGSSSQLIAHSSKVPAPQRHNSESILLVKDEQTTGAKMTLPANPMGIKLSEQSDISRSDSKLFPINTYVELNYKSGFGASALDISRYAIIHKNHRINIE